MEGVRNGTTPTISMPLTVTLLIINIGAIVVNTPLVITIFALSNIRKNASYVHAVCLCLADLLASLTAIYKFLVLSGTVSCLDIDGCITVCRYLETVFAFTVILDIVAINIDKFYAIKFTIHYTNNATIVNSAVLHVIMFIVVAGISIIPIFTQNAQLNGVSLHAINYSNNSYVDECIVLVFFFVIPLVAMTLISVSIYLVARRSMMRVGPVGQFVCKEESERKSSESRRANTMHSVAQIDKNYQSKNNSMQAVNNGRPVIENEGSFCEYLSKVETECDERAHQEENNIKTLRSGLPTFTFLAVRSVTPSTALNRSLASVGDGAKRSASTVGCQRIKGNNSGVNSLQSPNVSQTKPWNFKALINLTGPVLYFLLVWGPYFTINLIHNVYNAFETDIRAIDFIATIDVVVHLSFALNPFVFVIYRRDFREEVVGAIERLKGQTNVDADMCAENTFMEFIAASHI